jgi:6-phosphogluconolactonase
LARSLLFVGSCNRALPYFASANGEGIAAFAFDDATGAAAPLGVTVGVDNPTFLAVSPDGRTLYATSEVLGWNEGLVTAYAIDAETGALDYLNKQPTRGSIAAQMSFDRMGAHLLLVNYGVGPVTQKPNRSLVVFPLGADGSVGAPMAEVTHEGRGIDPERQERPHAHCVVAAPDGGHFVVADLGLDLLVAYRFEGALREQTRFALPPGSGPRHFTFHPRLSRLYVANELNSTVAAVEYEADTGAMRLRGVWPTVPAPDAAGNHCAEIKLSPDGRWLFVANRGYDRLAMFAVDPSSGELMPAGHFASGGRTPRHFAFDPSGRFLAVANQDSDRVEVFGFDAATGALTPGPAPLAVGTPTCVAFAAPPR